MLEKQHYHKSAADLTAWLKKKKKKQPCLIMRFMRFGGSPQHQYTQRNAADAVFTIAGKNKVT
jgi:hypothetical protein